MVRRHGRPFWFSVIAVAAALAMAAPVFAQGNSIRGTVRDDQGQPVQGATITISMENTGRKFQTKSDRRGSFIQIGLTSGTYVVVGQCAEVSKVLTGLTCRPGPAVYAPTPLAGDEFTSSGPGRTVTAKLPAQYAKAEA